MQILLVDDHALFREGLALVLRQLGDDTRITEAENARTALQAIQNSPGLDLVLLDLNLPDNNDLSLLQQIRNLLPATPIAMLSAVEEPSMIQRALHIGASGFITKSANSQVMLQAIQLILAGGLYLPPQLLQSNPAATTMVEKVAQPATIPTPHLTERQKEVLRLLDEGFSNKEIAKKLDMSPSTVKVHVAAILRECNASNRTQAVSLARQQGLI